MHKRRQTTGSGLGTRSYLMWGLAVFFSGAADLAVTADIPTFEELGLEKGEKEALKTVRPQYSADNPHGRGDGCSYCHQMKQQEALPIERNETDKLCISCHDGEKGPAEAHPTGRTVAPERFTIPEGWPLPEGKLACLTCHNVKQGCQAERGGAAANPAFLRGKLGRNKMKFCENCHLPQRYRRHSPHVMRRDSDDILQLVENNNIAEESCQFCHAQQPERGVLERSGNAHLRVGELVLCRICHSRHEEYYSPGHIGATLSADMRAYMYAREMVGPAVRIGPELLARLKKAQAAPTVMIPNSEGKITCSTCHNPHQEGVFPADSVLNRGAMWLIGPGRVKSPTAKHQMCTNCHQQ